MVINHYMGTHLLANLGWVDFDLECSTILPSCSTSSANFPSAQAEPGRGWNSPNQSQPNPAIRPDGPPCIANFCCPSFNLASEREELHPNCGEGLHCGRRDAGGALAGFEQDLVLRRFRHRGPLLPHGRHLVRLHHGEAISRLAFEFGSPNRSDRCNK